MSSNPNPGYLLYIGSCITQLHIGNIINHCKDPYEPMSIMECQGFERCSLPKLCVNQPMSQPITYISYNITIAFNCYINQPITNNWYTNLIGWSFFSWLDFWRNSRSIDQIRWFPGSEAAMVAWSGRWVKALWHVRTSRAIHHQSAR